MNLHDVVKGNVGAINPRVQLSLQRSTGYATNPDGKRVPTYGAPIEIWGQVQALQFRDIQMMQSLTLQGTRKAIYLDGRWDGLVRNERKGGDLITFPDGSVWLIALVLENWRDWTKVAATLQDGS